MGLEGFCVEQNDFQIVIELEVIHQRCLERSEQGNRMWFCAFWQKMWRHSLCAIAVAKCWLLVGGGKHVGGVNNHTFRQHIALFGYYSLMNAFICTQVDIFESLFHHQLFRLPFLVNQPSFKMTKVISTTMGGALVMWTLLGVCRSQWSLFEPRFLSQGCFF